jgi:hypothetical protein
MRKLSHIKISSEQLGRLASYTTSATCIQAIHQTQTDWVTTVLNKLTTVYYYCIQPQTCAGNIICKHFLHGLDVKIFEEKLNNLNKDSSNMCDGQGKPVTWSKFKILSIEFNTSTENLLIKDEDTQNSQVTSDRFFQTVTHMFQNIWLSLKWWGVKNTLELITDIQEQCPDNRSNGGVSSLQVAAHRKPVLTILRMHDKNDVMSPYPDVDIVTMRHYVAMT